MSGEAFFDSNGLLYLISSDLQKAEQMKTLLARRGVISVQVLNEFASVASRKYAVDWPTVRAVLAGIREVCSVEPVAVVTHEDAMSLAERYRFSFYDSLIVASALLAGCSTLYSEDMQHGQVVGGLTIRNPFRVN